MRLKLLRKTASSAASTSFRSSMRFRSAFGLPETASQSAGWRRAKRSRVGRSQLYQRLFASSSRRTRRRGMRGLTSRTKVVPGCAMGVAIVPRPARRVKGAHRRSARCTGAARERRSRDEKAAPWRARPLVTRALVQLLVLPELRAGERAARLESVLGERVVGGVRDHVLAAASAHLVAGNPGLGGAAAAELPTAVHELLHRLLRLEDDQRLVLR